MDYNFWQILIITLILLLFGKDYIPAFLKKFFGIETNGNSKKNGNNIEIDALKAQIETLQDNHLHALGEKIDNLNERMIEHNALEISLLQDIKEILKNP